MAQDVATLFRRAYDLVDQQKFSEARPILEECLRLGPGPSYDTHVRQELARVLRELGDLQGALNLRMEVKRLAPDKHANLWKLAQLLAELGSLREALTEAREALRLNPNNFRYRETLDQITSALRNSEERSSGRFSSVYTDTALGFQVEIPEGWEAETKSHLLARLRNWIEQNAVDVYAPEHEGFARMAVSVRKVGRRALSRQRVEYSGETRMEVSGLPAIQAEYVTAGTTFRKVSLVKGGREYLLQFGHDGTFNTTIDRVVKSFRLL